MEKEGRKKVGYLWSLGTFDPEVMAQAWIDYRDPETGEPINYTWRAAGSSVSPNHAYDEYFFEDFPNGLDGLPSSAVDATVKTLWGQWWAWKRGELT